MRNALLLAALTLASATAFASKARQSALQEGRTVASDFQEIFEQPSKMWDLADQATFEYGAANGTPNAEGGFIRSGDNTKWGMYLGRTNDSLRSMLGGVPLAGTGLSLGTAFQNDPDGAGPATAQTVTQATNPLNIFYGGKAGDMNYGLSAYYAASENEGSLKKNAMGLSFGVGAEGWIANAVVGLGAKFEDIAGNEEFKADSSYKLDSEYAINDVMLGYATLTMFGGTRTVGGAEQDKYNVQMIQAGVESKVKSDVAHFFYGARLENNTLENKTTGRKVEAMLLPVYLGVEADAASWLVLRTALSQNVLLGTAKVTGATGGTAAKLTPDSTKATLGAGLKFGKLIVDGNMAAQTGGALNANNFLTETSLTYVF